ncbi:TPA: hypothetical protein DD455_00435 [Candidatus Shapirobacteria bacterium]|nr:hypothetical protein [Candidatus Shapirobacteria bacterium]
MCEKTPTKKFVYPGGRMMCLDGLIRAAYTGTQILRCELTIEQIERMAKRGQHSLDSGADTNKRNLIYLIVYGHAHRGDLTDYVDTEGNFVLNNMGLSNVFSSRNQNTLNKLLTTGILHD